MVAYALGSAIVGLALAWAAAHRLSGRLPQRSLVLPTGAGGGLVGGLVAYAVMGPGNLGLALVISAAVSVAMLSLLHGRSARPAPRATAAPRIP